MKKNKINPDRFFKVVKPKCGLIILLIMLCASLYSMAKNQVTAPGEAKESVYVKDNTDHILINFGRDSSTTGWNHLTNYTKLTTITNLKDKKGNTTGISLVYAEKFNGGRHVLGAKETATDFNMPESVSSQELHGNSSGTGKAVLRLEGLSKDKKYDLCFFGSRMGVSAKDNRETKYIVTGKSETTALLNLSNNTSKIACTYAVQPDENGRVIITITTGENNNNLNGYYGISAMRLTSLK